MTNLEIKSFSNIRHLSIRKKTASRICSTQVLYEASFLANDIDKIIKSYMKGHLSFVLSSLEIKNFDEALFNRIIKGVSQNSIKIDRIISSNLSKDWSLERLSKTEISILRLATFELCFDKKFNKSTIINEYISIIEAFGGNTNFANGILENISKQNLLISI
ncbi:transcription antitermination factor NusB [Alphaproteobacteria bacterium]|nr:transcription antitermination factor NusB [Alphaproteobacteria bacterium]MDC1023300.1 transcription antitermination factor NusB [Alphaproteobacteria bacterium]